MTNYHIMTTEETKLLSKIINAHRQELDDLKNNIVNEDCTNWNEYVQACKPIMTVEKKEMKEFLADKPVISASKREGAITEACKIADGLGMTEVHLVKVSMDVKYTLHYMIGANWFLFKEGGIWFYKLKQDCQTANPVSF